jgi:hypothetical protein
MPGFGVNEILKLSNKSVSELKDDEVAHKAALPFAGIDNCASCLRQQSGACFL